MFEAHFTKAEDFQGLETVSYSWTKTYYRRHKVSFQELRIWFALGNRELVGGGSQTKTFVYIEYLDQQRNNQYRCLELASGFSVPEALELATNVTLTDHEQNPE